MEILCVPVGPLQANCYLVWDDDKVACAVDPGSEPERLLHHLTRRELDLRAVLVTHGHFDHVEGVKGLAEATKARIYCSRTVEPVLSGTQGCSATGYLIPAVRAPEIEIVDEGRKLAVGMMTVTVIATPGHTPGDLTFEIDGALFCGDLLFRRSVGRTDLPGGNFAQLLSSLARLARSYPPETPVYPGHMEATTLGDELAFNPFLSGLRVDG